MYKYKNLLFLILAQNYSHFSNCQINFKYFSSVIKYLFFNILYLNFRGEK